MRQPSGRLSDRTLPPLSTAERAASARGGTSPPPGRSSQGESEPPPGRQPIERAPPGRHGRARGDPPGIPEDWGKAFGQGPPGHHSRAQSPPAQGPPGRAFPLRVGPAPPGRETARGDPPLFGWRPSGQTYGCKSGPLFFAGFSNHKDPPFARKATGPPGVISTGMIACRPPPWNGRPKRSRLVGRRSRGDPPGTAASRRCCDPPRSVAGPAPPGPVRPIPIGRAPPGRRFHRRRGPPGSFRPPSSLSAGRCRERIPDVRPEMRRHDVARKPKPKSRKITPWL